MTRVANFGESLNLIGKRSKSKVWSETLKLQAGALRQLFLDKGARNLISGVLPFVPQADDKTRSSNYKQAMRRLEKRLPRLIRYDEENNTLHWLVLRIADAKTIPDEDWINLARDGVFSDRMMTHTGRLHSRIYGVCKV